MDDGVTPVGGWPMGEGAASGAQQLRVDPDRVVSALNRHLLGPGEEVELRRDWPDGVVVQTAHHSYTAAPAGWRVGGEPWVEDAVRVVATGYGTDVVACYGLVFARSSGVLFLNDVVTMNRLGGRLGTGVAPLAYAELLSEFYSGSNVDQPVVLAMAATESWPAGSLVNDVAEFHTQFPFVDPGLVAAPVVEHEDGRVAMEFYSWRYFLTQWQGALDILRWRVGQAHDGQVVWSREFVAQGVEWPWPVET